MLRGPTQKNEKRGELGVFVSLVMIGIVGGSLLGGSGCQSLWVKLAVRDFARAVKKGKKRKVMKRSTIGLNGDVWEKMSSEEFVDIAKQLKKLLKKKGVLSTRMAGKGGGNGKRKKRKKKSSKRKISVKVHKRRAWLRYRKGRSDAKFHLRKKKDRWLVDDVAVKFGDSKLSLRRDFSLYESGHGFLQAAKKGSRKDLMSHSSESLSDAIGGLSEAMIRRASRSLNLVDDDEGKEEKDPAKKKERVRYRFQITDNLARLERMKGEDLYGVVMVREGGVWKVDDILVSYDSLSDKKKVASLKNLMRVASTVRDFIKALVTKNLKGLLGMSSARKRKKIFSRMKRKQIIPLPVPRSPNLLGQDFSKDRATLVLGRDDKRLTAKLFLEAGRWKVDCLRLDMGDKSITLSEALRFRKTLLGIVRAGFKADVAALQRLSSQQLNEKVWKRLGSLSKLKTKLLKGGLDKLIGIRVLPKNAFHKMAFIAKTAAKLNRVRKGNVRLKAAWSEKNKGYVVIKVFDREVRARLVKVGDTWKLDDVTWNLPSGVRSFKEAAAAILSP